MVNEAARFAGRVPQFAQQTGRVPKLTSTSKYLIIALMEVIGKVVSRKWLPHAVLGAIVLAGSTYASVRFQSTTWLSPLILESLLIALHFGASTGTVVAPR